jgi:hypothetical protein
MMTNKNFLFVIFFFQQSLSVLEKLRCWTLRNIPQSPLCETLLIKKENPL